MGDKYDSSNFRPTSIFQFCKKYQKTGLQIKAVPLQAWSDPEGSRKLLFMTTAQDGGRLSALRTGRLYPQ
jgi:hypothetical protein